MAGRRGSFFLLQFEGDLEAALEAHGHMPLPPYIERDAEALDRDRYQTVYARRPGAVAAPTAGLHFDAALLERSLPRRVSGKPRSRCTWAPARSCRCVTSNSKPAACTLNVSRSLTQQCERCARPGRDAGGRVVAVGTTVTRALEAAAAGGDKLQPFSGETDIFIYPGYEFRVVDALVTNFHLPESSLMMLVAAFRGRDAILDAYRHAVEAGISFLQLR